MPVITIHGNAARIEPAVRMGGRAAMAVAGCLFMSLAFVTATAFVRSAWAVQSFQIAIFALLALYLIAGIGRWKIQIDSGLTPWLLFLIPLWGVFQLVAHTTSSSFETRQAALRWGALAGVFLLTQAVARTREARHNFLSAFLCLAVALAVLCLAQLFTSEGRVFWVFPSGYPDVYATFAYNNNFVELIELALPIALYRAVREGWRCWWYALAGGLLYAAAIGSASRMGAALCTAELLAMIVIGLVRFRDPETGMPSRSTTLTLVLIPVLAAAFTLVVGWERVWERFQEGNPYFVRREFVLAAADMAAQRPLTGFGLGTFPAAYQRYAIKDFPFYANHAHNDWAEFAAEGGVPFLLLVLVPFLRVAPAAIRNPWGLGLIAILLHACVDYPFPRPAVSAWIFVMLALLYSALAESTRRLPAVTAPRAQRPRA